MGLKAKLLFWLSGILHIANSRPHIIDSYVFYKIKNRVLEKHGVYLGYEYQHVYKHCYKCSGTGEYNWSDEQCWDCHGTGTFTEFWSKLEKYKFGEYTFHKPANKYYYKPEELVLNETLKPIEGIINHKYYPDDLVANCFFILTLLFHRKWFGEYLGYRKYSNNGEYFWVGLNNFIFNTKKFKRDIVNWRWRRDGKDSEGWMDVGDDVPPF